VGAASLSLFGAITAGAAGADTVAPAFYLALGASASVGVQPTVAVPKGEPTNRGYANDVVAYEAARGVTVQLTQLGCPGESTTTMINGNDHCYRLHDTQLALAMSFLLKHQSNEGIVTIDLGYNNFRHCFKAHTVNQSCVTKRLSLVKEQLPMVIAGLKSAAGPGVTFVGLGHYNPFLASGASGPAGQEFATDTNVVIDQLNSTLQALYANEGIPLAPVATTFGGRDVQRVRVYGGTVLPDNVAQVCALTWMCQPAPYGPNMHPNDAGYAAIALAIESVLKTPWSATAPTTTSAAA
jgi:lysophospholipase L1-like esterase